MRKVVLIGPSEMTLNWVRQQVKPNIAYVLLIVINLIRDEKKNNFKEIQGSSKKFNKIQGV